MKIFNFFILFIICNSLIAQETFPLNGVSENFEPIYAFTNATIVYSPGLKLENGILLVKGDKIIAMDTSLEIPNGSIVFNLKGDYIYPSFIDLYSNYKIKLNHLKIILKNQFIINLKLKILFQILI